MRGPKEKACLLRGPESCAMVGSAWVGQGQAGSLARACRVYTGQSLVRTGAGPGCWWGGLAQVSGDVARGEGLPCIPCAVGGMGLCPAGGAGRNISLYMLSGSPQHSSARCGTRKFIVCFAWGLPKQPKTHW